MLSPEIVITAVLALIISMIITRLLIPWTINSCMNQGITTVDAHKPNSPTIAEAGGLAPLLGFIFTILIIVFIWENIPWENVMPQTQSEIFKPLLAGLLLWTASPALF